MAQDNFGALYQGKTTWGTPTGDLSRATFDTSTVTLDELAQVVAALVTDLQALRALMVIAPPAAPTLVTPADAAVTTDTTPTFDWTDVADADTYEIEIADDSGFTSVVQSDTGLLTSTYTATSLSEDTYYWRVRARNDGGVSSWTAGRSLDVVSAPANTGAPVISGTQMVGQTLTTSDGTWTGTAPITYTYQWKRDGVNISAATNDTYTLVAADAGTEISVTVAATNAGGNANETSDETDYILFDVSLAVRWWSPRFGDLKQNSDNTVDVTTTDDPVGYIPDRSSSADPAIQATGSLKGRYKPTGVNGYPGIEITTDDFYSFTSSSNVNFTVFLVATRIGTNTAVNYLLGGTGSGVHIGGSFSSPEAYGYFTASAARRANEAPTTPEIFTFQNAALFKNGVEATYSLSGTSTTLAVSRIGKRADLDATRFNGVFGDIIICPSVLSADNRNSIGRYLAAVYGKTWGN